MSRNRRRRSTLIRRVVEGDQAEEEVIGLVDDELENVLRTLRGERPEADEYSTGLGERPVMTYGVPEEGRIDSMRPYRPLTSDVPDRMGDTPVDMPQFDADGVQRESIYIHDESEAVLIIAWGNERFTVRFPVKADAPEPIHDLPVGRIEWIIEERVDEE